MTTRHTLLLTMPNGRICMVDITDALANAYYAADGPDETPVPASIASALQPANPADVSHRIVVLVTADFEAQPRGGEMPVLVDQEAAARLLAAGWRPAS